MVAVEALSLASVADDMNAQRGEAMVAAIACSSTDRLEAVDMAADVDSDRTEPATEAEPGVSRAVLVAAKDRKPDGGRPKRRVCVCARCGV